MEGELAGALRGRAGGSLEEILAADFTFTSERGVLDRAGLLAALRRAGAACESVALDEQNVRPYGGAAVSTGRVSVRRCVAAAAHQAGGETRVADAAATVNLGELARREATRGQQRPAERRAVHPPVPTPKPLPVPPDAFLGSRQYRYTAVYVRRRGRWQAVSLHLTRITQ